jgi:hypothetical protein
MSSTISRRAMTSLADRITGFSAEVRKAHDRCSRHQSVSRYHEELACLHRRFGEAMMELIAAEAGRTGRQGGR